MRRLLPVWLVLGVACFGCYTAAEEDPAIKQIDDQIAKASVNKEQSGWKQSLPMPEKVTFDSDKSYYANMKTNKGPIRIKLMPEVAPMHVTSFIYLTRVGFYDGIAFHRVIPGFMAQGGCPIGTGTGSPGYKYGGETDPDVKHDKPGLLSAANTGRPNTDGSQFFLTFVPTAWLDGKHTIYGQVVGDDSMQTLKVLESHGSRSGSTNETLLIDEVTIEVE